ncbi:MAG TPA: SAM-dependent methyltransferase [Micromonosporaceae bacterium]|nr:SAM-dependent methyltransferase [Micromonosporaceae bacterium]
MTEPSSLSTTRAAYDTMAVEYAERFSLELAGMPLTRGLLGAFTELVQAADARPVADLGCGPGHVTAHLHTLGLNAFGVDLSPKMVAVARQTHPGLRFDEGSMTALDLPDATLGGIVALYSIIHIPTEQLPAAFAEFHRVLAPGGQLLIAFLVGDEQRHRTEAFGHTISLDYYLRPPDSVAELLTRCGFRMRAQMLREADGEAEKLPRAYLLASKQVLWEQTDSRSAPSP